MDSVWGLTRCSSLSRYMCACMCAHMHAQIHTHATPKWTMNVLILRLRENTDYTLYFYPREELFGLRVVWRDVKGWSIWLPESNEIGPCPFISKARAGQLLYRIQGTEFYQWHCELIWHWNVEAERSEVQGYPWLQNEFKVSLGYKKRERKAQHRKRHYEWMILPAPIFCPVSYLSSLAPRT